MSWCREAEIFFWTVSFLGRNVTLFDLQSDRWQASKVFCSSSKVTRDWTVGRNTTVHQYMMPVAAFSSYPWTQTFELGVAGCLKVHSIMSAICNQSTRLIYALSLHPTAEFLKNAFKLHELPATYVLISWTKNLGGWACCWRQVLEHSMPTPAYITVSVHIPLEHRYLCFY